MENLKIIHIDPKKNVFYVLRELTKSIFEYSIPEETWKYICTNSSWKDFVKKI